MVAYGALVPPEALDIPRHGWVNLHFSLLPAWRGAAPVQHAVSAGDEVTGATTFRLEEGLDTGPVFGVVTEAIRPDDTSGDLLGRLADSGAGLLVATLDGIDGRPLVAEPQPADGVSLAPKLDRRRRPRGLDGAGARGRPAGPRLHPGARRVDDVPRRAGQARPGRAQPTTPSRWRPASCASIAGCPRRHRRRSPCCSVRSSRRASRRCRRPTGRAASGSSQGSGSPDARLQPPRRPGGPGRGRPGAPRAYRRPRAGPAPAGRVRRCCAPSTERDAYANLVLPALLRERGLSGRDAAFATELTYGTLRGRGLYDAILAACVDRPLDAVDPAVLDVLRLGAHQLLAMRVPGHAAVSATVDLVRAVLGAAAGVRQRGAAQGRRPRRRRVARRARALIAGRPGRPPGRGAPPPAVDRPGLPRRARRALGLRPSSCWPRTTRPPG